jgi:hypothetical protein
VRSIVDILKRRQSEDLPRQLPEVPDEMDGRFAVDDPAAFQLVLKKRRNNGMLKKMLADAGYTDLAHMVTVKRERLEDDDNGN